MYVGTGHTRSHGRQTLPHLQLLPNHPVALSSALSLPLAPVTEVIVC